MGLYFYDGFEALFGVLFLVVVAVFVVTFVRGIGTWHSNNQSPRLTVPAEVVTKRTQVSHHHHNTGDVMTSHTTMSTTYYATFQVESGDRMEFCINGVQYGQLAEGDWGQLSFQGTRYLDFVRQPRP